MRLFGLGKKKDVSERDFNNNLPIDNKDGLIGFGDSIEKVEYKSYHKAYKWGNEFYFVKSVSVWKLINKYGMPFTDTMHSFKIGTWGDLEGQVGAAEYTYRMDEIYAMNNGLKNMISDMIRENGQG